MTLLDALAAQFPNAKRSTLRAMIREGRVTVGGVVAVSAKLEVPDAQTVRVNRHAARRVGRPGPHRPFDILHEDADLIVIDKPHGLMTQSGARDRRPTLVGLLNDFLVRRDGERSRARLVHRLDADAAGVIVFSRNNAAHASLKRQFADHSAGRVYLALVDGVPRPPSGQIASRLVELADGRVRSTKRTDRGEPAVTHYEVLRSGGAGQPSLVRAQLQTGRKHQIRVHLSERGWPILNDRLYHPRPGDGWLCLVAVELSLEHPRTGKRVVYRRPAPAWVGADKIAAGGLPGLRGESPAR